MTYLKIPHDIPLGAVFEIEIITRLNIRKSYHIFSYASLKKNTYYFFSDKYFQLIHPYPHIFSSHFQTALPPQDDEPV